LSGIESPSRLRVSPFSFNGNAVEFFKIWIVNIFLMIFTLGLYSPWAKVRKLRYLYGNTYLDDNRFDYLADPVRILKGRLVSVTALVGYYLAWDFYPDAGMALLVIGALLLPFALVTATSFQMRNTSYRNIRFSFQSAYKTIYRQLAAPLGIVLILTGIAYTIFDLNWIPAYESNPGDVELVKSDFITLIFLLVLMPVIPYFDYLRAGFIVNHTQFGNLDAEFEGAVWSFYKIYLQAVLIFILIVTLLASSIGGLVFLLTFYAETDSAELFTNQSFGVIFVTIFYLLNFIVVAFLKARRTNLIYQQTIFGDYASKIQIVSKIKTWRLCWIYISNTLLVLISLGMLIPWAKIRTTRYFATCVEIESRGLDTIKARNQDDQSALGDEFLNAFDMDLGI